LKDGKFFELFTKVSDGVAIPSVTPSQISKVRLVEFNVKVWCTSTLCSNQSKAASMVINQINKLWHVHNLVELLVGWEVRNRALQQRSKSFGRRVERLTPLLMFSSSGNNPKFL
jgi:hypothetical protein